MIRFQVEEVFTIRSRGLKAVAVGRLLDGPLTTPVVLEDATTAARVRVRGIDLIAPRDRELMDPEVLSLQIDETSPTVPRSGAVLTGPVPTPEDTTSPT